MLRQKANDHLSSCAWWYFGRELTGKRCFVQYLLLEKLTHQLDDALDIEARTAPFLLIDADEDEIENKLVENHLAIVVVLVDLRRNLIAPCRRRAIQTPPRQNTNQERHERKATRKKRNGAGKSALVWWRRQR